MRKTRFVIIVFLMIGAMSIPGMMGNGFEQVTAQDGEFTVGPQAGELGPTGSLAYAVLICQYAGDTIAQTVVDQVTGLYTGTGIAAMPTFFGDISYGQFNLDGSTYEGTFTLTGARGSYATALDVAEDCAGEADSEVTFANYDGIVFLVNDNTTLMQAGKDFPLTALGGQPYNISVVPEDEWLSARNAARQLATSFGLVSTSAGPSTNPQLATDNPSPWDFLNGWDFKNGNSVGSTLTDGTYGDLPQGMSARVLAEDTGWIPDIHEETVEIDTSREIQLTKINGVATAVDRFIRIPVDVGGTVYYTVEVRKQEGYDQNLPGAGVIIHNVDTQRSTGVAMQVVDPDSDLDLTNAVWGVGDVFTDTSLPDGGIKIEILSTDNGDTFAVYVTNQVGIGQERPPQVTGLNVAENIVIRDSNQANGFDYQVRLEWPDVVGEESYRVYWLDDAPDEGDDQEWTVRQFGVVANAGETTVTSVDEGLECATTYYYQVRSRNEGRESLWGNVESVTTGGCPGDTNGDGYYTPIDLVYVANRLGTTDVKADATADGTVDEGDVQFVLDRLGTGDGLD